jgi:protein SCO1/2
MSLPGSRTLRCVSQFAAVALLFAVPVLSGCRRSEPAASQEEASHTYPVTGIVRSINFADRTVTIEHSDIPGYMPAMTMPFELKSFAEAEPLKAGEPIAFKLVVTEKTSWIEGITKVDRSQVQLPEAPASPRAGSAAARLKEGDRVPEFKLTDSKGREITPATFQGKPLLVTFIFTRCPVPNFCPLISRNLKEVAEESAKEGGPGGALQLLSISIDPEHDTPEVLAQYAAAYTSETDRWRFARGTPAETQRLTQAFAVSVQPEGGTINHTLTTALIDPEGVIRQIWRGNGWKPAEVLAALGQRKEPGK